MKLFYFIIIAFLSGCASKAGQSSAFDNKEFKSNSGKVWTVNKLKDDYKNKTGMTLIGPDTSVCAWDSECYYNKWAMVYDKDLSAYENKISNQKAIKERAEKESKCLADKECKRNKDLTEAMKDLSWSYTVLLSTNQYSQSEYDYAVRSVCESTTSAQKNGVSQQKVLDSLRDLPGLGFQEREYFLSAAKACWNISNLKGNWKLALRSQY